MRGSRRISSWRAAALGLAAAGLLAAQAGPPAERVRVLIGFKRQPGPSEQALVRAFGGHVRHTYWLIPAIAAELPPQAVRALQSHPAVSVIEPDVPVQAIQESYDWGVAKIGSPSLHTQGLRGLGAKVCVIDSGIDTDHPDLQPNYRGGYDFVNGDPDPSDDNGHGTHVAGTVAAALNNTGLIGVAPGADIYAYKILDQNGSGSFSDAIAALERCIQDTGGKAVTNNSYGSSADPGTLVKAAFENAYLNHGLLHVAAAGNATAFSCNQVSYPARYDSVIAVGATNSSDSIASWSCRGPEVELSAPGVGITSTYPDNTYATASGTSMASPHAAGAAALVISANPVDQNGDGKVNQTDVRACLQRTALDRGTTGRDTSYGFGRLQADLAVSACLSSPDLTSVAAPTNLRATATGRDFVKLAWTDNATNEAYYDVERCTGTGCTNFTLLATLPADWMTYADSGLSRRTTYRYRVRARNGLAASAYSTVVSVTTK